MDSKRPEPGSPAYHLGGSAEDAVKDIRETHDLKKPRALLEYERDERGGRKTVMRAIEARIRKVARLNEKNEESSEGGPSQEECCQASGILDEKDEKKQETSFFTLGGVGKNQFKKNRKKKVNGKRKRRSRKKRFGVRK